MSEPAVSPLSTREAMLQARRALEQQRSERTQDPSGAAAASASVSASITPALPASSSSSYASRVEFQQLLDIACKCSGAVSDPAWERVLPHIKNWLRGHDELAPLAVELILARLLEPTAVARINVVRIVDAFFMRSKAFRTELLPHLNTFLQRAVGIGGDSKSNAPKPPLKAKELQMLSVSCVRNWTEAFGSALKLLRLAHDFMASRVSGMHVPTQLESERAAESRLAAQRQRTQRLLAVRYARLTAEFEPAERELQRVIREIDNALEMLFPQRDAQHLGEYMRNSTSSVEEQKQPEEQTKSEEADEPTSKRQRSDTRSTRSSPTAASSSEQAVAASSSAAAAAFAAPSLAESAENDAVEWEDEATASSAAPSAATTAAAAVAAPPAAPSVPLTGAAAAFGEFAAPADSHWWLDDQGDDEQDPMEGEEEMEEGAERLSGEGGEEAQAANAATPSQHGIGKDYSLLIEFDANVGAMENEDNSILFDSLRDGWTRIQKSFIPLLAEWIDTLTRIDVERMTAAEIEACRGNIQATASAGPTAAAAATSAAAASASALLRQRDSYLQRCISSRSAVDVLRAKCARLNIRVSTLQADRLNVVRRETERTIVAEEGEEREEEEKEVNAAPTNLRTRAAASSPSVAAASSASNLSVSAAESLAHTRHAAELTRKRVAAEKRATTKIRNVKRKHAKELEVQRMQARLALQSAAAPTAAPPQGDPLRRSFSGHADRVAPAAAGAANSETL